MFTGQPHVTITNNHRAGPSARPEHTRSCLKAYTAMFMVLNGHYGGSLSALFVKVSTLNFSNFELVQV